ncbi:DNA polymerase III subunit beta family protein [Streptomyces fradiae]|uniref:DNA polymerase III subunit beta family protein n=1 Tax=Streptomyces fradiae TaxID=1906 RepID=UPI0029428E53|nr:MerR family transcriptional regulator [Streptomyces fradiae]WOI58655.1 MerR family transcriptional regulator [Streptomyces fradiae]
MPNSEMMPIGLFARRTGLTASALRFYADCGLLVPAEVDPVTGYRSYSSEQVAHACDLRRLREIAMPLPAVRAVLDAGPAEAARLVDDHVAKVLEDAAAVRRKAAAFMASRTEAPGRPVAVVRGPVLADAVEQVLTAAGCDPDLPVLGGLRVEASCEAVTLTATDRYRLSTRSLVPAEPVSTAWAATVDGDEVRGAVAAMRRSVLVRVEAARHALRFRTADGEERYCRLLPDPFPDHRLMLASLPEAGTRVTVDRNPLLHALEQHAGELITLRTTRHALHVRHVLSDGDVPSGVRLPATVTGPDLQARFAFTTLYPAVSTALGPDLMLDLRGPDLPVTIRSADRGDLITLAMPTAPDPRAAQNH